MGFFFFNRVIPVISVVLRKTTLTISMLTGEPISTESETERVVFVSTTEITEITRLKIQSSGDRCLHSLPNDKIRRIENIVGKGENAGYQHFILFLQCFQKASFPGSLKVGVMWQRVKHGHYNDLPVDDLHNKNQGISHHALDKASLATCF